MIKRIAFVCRNPSLSADEFHARWRGPHAELFAKNPAVTDHVLRYEQNHRKPRDYDRADCPYDGAIIQWFESVEMIVSERIGRETVQYVGNIYKYYIAYRLVSEESERRAAERARLKGGRG